MSEHIFLVGKRKYCGGLLWQALTKPREQLKEARELGKRLKCDLMVLRHGRGYSQVGMGSKADGSIVGAISIAALITEYIAAVGVEVEGKMVRPHTYLVALPLTDAAWIFVAVREGNITPQGDVVGTFHSTISALDNNYGVGGFEAVLGTEEVRAVGYDRFGLLDFKTLQQFVEKSRKVERKISLRPVQFQINKNALVLGSVLCLLFGGAGFVVKKNLDKRREAEEAAQRSALQAQMQAQTSTTGKELTAPPPKPWATTPTIEAFIPACTKTLADFAPGGWRLKAFACKEGASEHLWVRVFGTAATLLAVRPTAVLSVDGSSATMQQPLEVVPPDSPEDLQPWELVRTEFITALQTLNIGFTLPEKPEPGKTPEPLERNGQKVVFQPADWKEYAFKIGPTRVEPERLMSILVQPGLRVTKVAFSEGKWTLEGTAYAK